uniref:Phenoloxidase-activating factor 2 n=1 Tax=Anopheles culicifacies TaxID=139723 RepID=A0A182M075_9DIPT
MFCCFTPPIKTIPGLRISMVSRIFVLLGAVALMGGLVTAQDTLDDLYLSLYNLTENKNTVTEPPTAAPVAAVTQAAVPAEQRFTCTGECVQYYLCSDNKIITDGAGIIDIRVGEDANEEYECPHFLNTCCEKDAVLVEPPPTVTKAPPTNNDGPEPHRPTCGFRNVDGLGFRITGNKNGESEYGEFPWMLAVLREERVADNNLNVYECGGSLIAPNVVLTAAHCVFNKQKEQLLIRAGEWDTQTRDELYQHQDRRVAEVITHGSFNKGSLANDVALLILNEPFQLAENVQPICLPPKGTSFDRSKCFASGWGKNIFGKEGKYQVILKKVELPSCAGNCVPYNLCSDSKTITDGTRVIDIRVGEETECSSYLHVCCDKYAVLAEPTNTATKSVQANRSKIRQKTCGLRNTNGVGFRITGNINGESEYGEFPWILALLLEKSTDGNSLKVYHCGGSLIAPYVVLTAAHCVYNVQKDKLLIRAGEWDTQTRDEYYQHQDRRVAEVITHDAFNKGSLANDVALLILMEPFQLAENVQPICLPPKGTSFDRSKCFASGWGKNIFGKEGLYQVILKKVELPVVPHGECQQSLRTTRLGKRFVLHQSFLCAGGVAGQDTCRGDGGSPLVCPIPGSSTHYYQAGIVAWGIGCGENGIPGVYGNVAYFRDWIDQQLINYSILSRDYIYTP